MNDNKLKELREELFYYTEAGKKVIESNEFTGEDRTIALTRVFTLMQIIDVMDNVLNGEEPKTALLNGFKHKGEE